MNWFNRIVRALRQAWSQGADAEEVGRPKTRAEKYAVTAFAGLERQRREAEERIAEAFVASVNDAFARIQFWKPPADRVGGAMDARDELISLRQAMDSSENGLPAFKEVMVAAGNQMALMPWYMRQGFIGYQNAAFISQHWLIYKGCSTPINDAIRNGYDIVTDTGEDLDEDALKLVKRADRRMGIRGAMREFGTKGRVFGVRIALFEVESTDDNYYTKPFNIDGVGAGKYKGISQVDPYWCAPILSMNSAAVPSGRHFYEPEWWLIGSRRVHRSHLVIFRYADPADVLKPLYLFGGIPLPQMVMERCYAAERTANEAPELALSKRATIWMTDMAKVIADPQRAQEIIQNWVYNRDNMGVKMGDKDSEEFQQFDTPLADFDSLVMTQYGLVSSTFNMPITKLLGTTPGGFNATGEYDESSYHEELETIRERDLTPLIERHHLLVMKSEVVTEFPELADVQVVVNWHATDAMTHVEKATENLTKAQTGAALVASGAISSDDENARVAADKESGYHGIGKPTFEDEELPDDPEDQAIAAGAAGEARHTEEAAVKRETEPQGRSKGVLNGKEKAA